jgi:hypothetical protein
MNDVPAFTIGRPSEDHVTVTPLYRPHDQCHDYWDGNWIESRVDIRAGGFSGRFEASLRADEFETFMKELVALYESLRGEAKFSSLEEWLSIEVAGDGLGHFEARCQARDEAGIGNLLQFRLRFDQTETARIAAGLRSIIHAFPVRGSRGA